MLVADEKSLETTGRCEGPQVPFSSELQKFFTFSRKCQTDFSYTENYHRSRKFQFHERDLIKEFITYTMFFKKFSEETTMVDNTEEEGVVQSITERVIQESKKYNCEVHFNVIWVYYFIYRDEEINSLPVFKIHKGVGNGAVYVDAFSKVYQTWNCYIDGPGLGESLLCVPRNGEYYFDGDQLNLEFVLTKSIQLESKSNSNLWVKQVVPLFQCLQTWVMEVKSWLSDYLETHPRVNKCLNFFKENHQEIFNLAQKLLLAYFDFQFPVNCRTKLFAQLCFQAAKIVFSQNNMHSNFQVSQIFLTEITNFIANWVNYPEARELQVLLKSPSRHWVQILDCICSLIKKIRAKTTNNSKQQSIETNPAEIVAGNRPSGLFSPDGGSAAGASVPYSLNKTQIASQPRVLSDYCPAG